MTRTRLVAPLLSLVFLSASGAAFANAQYGPPPPPPRGYGQQGWDAPPGEFREVQRRGFHDGIEGARRDFDNHRRPDVNNRDEFRHPHIDPSLRNDYREGFERGYNVGVQHIYGQR